MYEVADIRIDTYEDGFWLVVDGNEDDSEPREAVEYRFKIEDGEQLYDRVNAAIGPWLREMHEARDAVARGVTLREFCCEPDESGGILVGIREDGSEHWEEDSDRKYDLAKEEGYDLSDPKHSQYHSIHADIWDAREGK